MIIDFSDIADLLLDKGIVSTRVSANSTSIYAVKWAQGVHLDRSNSQVAVNRARLRKIGLDIMKPFSSPDGRLYNLKFETNMKGFE